MNADVGAIGGVRDIPVITVSCIAPHLIRGLLALLRHFHLDNPAHVGDGSDAAKQLAAKGVCDAIDGDTLCATGHNIHHGPGTGREKRHQGLLAKLAVGEFPDESANLLDRTLLRWCAQVTLFELFAKGGVVHRGRRASQLRRAGAGAHSERDPPDGGGRGARSLGCGGRRAAPAVRGAGRACPGAKPTDTV